MLSPVLAAQDDYRDAWIVQGYCQLTTERPDEAKLSLERAYAIDPQKPEIQYFLARTFSKLGDHQAAVTYLKYAIENGFSPLAEAKRLLAAEAFATGDTALALQQLDEIARADGASIDAYADFVTAALGTDRKEEAYAMAQSAVAAHPDNAVAHDLLGWAAAETKRKDEARAELQKALDLDPTLQSARDRLSEL
jgi:tetratricopeptide (TPR) repeat protein